MKNLYTLPLLIISNLGFSQCEILGENTIDTGKTYEYSINNELAQCKQCHHWTTIGNTSIISDNRLNSISVKALSPGKATIALQYLSNQGLVKCSKEVEIITFSSSTQNSSTDNRKNGDCDIQVSNFKEVKISAQKIAFLTENQQDLVYTWEAHYKDNTKVSSNEKVPQFPFSEDNPITKVEVKIFSKTCYSKFSKNYDGNFWKYLK